MSGDARLIVTKSGWNQGLPGDSANRDDILLIDRQTDSRTIISQAPDGTPTNDSSRAPSLSEAGDRVVLLSQAINLIDQDSNNQTDAFLWDARGATPTLRRIGERLDGETLIEPDWGIALAVISGDGSTIAFTSRSNGILPGLTTGLGQVYHYDIDSDTTTLVTDDGSGQPQTDRWFDVVDLSHDGRFILYRGINLHLYDAETGSSQLITTGGGLGNRHDLTPDGRYVLLISSTQLVVSDTDDSQDLYLFDREAAPPGLTLLDVSPPCRHRMPPCAQSSPSRAPCSHRMPASSPSLVANTTIMACRPTEWSIRAMSTSSPEEGRAQYCHGTSSPTAITSTSKNATSTTAVS